ncbi:MAG: hypothetical protein NVS4B9_40080 [Ktedonobacteraceae bacterium]
MLSYAFWIDFKAYNFCIDTFVQITLCIVLISSKRIYEGEE